MLRLCIPALLAGTVASSFVASLSPAGVVACAHEVPHGSHVTHHDEGGFTVVPEQGEVLRIAPCNETQRGAVRGGSRSNETGGAFKGGWQVYTKQDFSSTPVGTVGVHSFVGAWNVPDAPKTYTGQTVFLFTGLQNMDWVPPDDGPKGKFDIVQPVLQYGPSSAGGGEFWMMSSWYVPLGGWFDEAVYSKPVAVKEGDQIFGNMTRTGTKDFFIDACVQGNATSHTSITVSKPRLTAQPFAYVTFESYADYNNLTCDMWPTKPSVFTGLKHGSSGFNWTVVNKDSVCNASIQVDPQSTDVTINF